MVIRLRIEKNNVVDTALLLLMYLQLVILEFFGYGQTLNKIVSLLILFRLFFLTDKQSPGILIRAVGIITLYILSALLSDTFIVANVWSNFLMQLYPFIYAYYIYFICKNKPAFLDSLLRKGFWIFNITIIVNIIAMCIQIAVPYSINAVNIYNTSSTTVYYEDLISGLFAYSSTHVVCLFTIFIILYDLVYWKKLKNRMLKRLLGMYCVAITLISILISLNNDNKAFFLLFPLAILIYWLAEGSHEIQRKINRIVLFPCAILLIIVALYVMVPAFNKFLNDNVLSLLNMMGSAVSKGNLANGSNERISMVFDALGRGSTWLLGTGFGCNHLYKSGYLGYNHFGQADMGALLFLGGIWYVALLFSSYFKMSQDIIYGMKMNGKTTRKNRYTNKMMMIFVFVMLLCMMTYTQCFTRTNTVTSLMLIILALRMRYQYQFHRQADKMTIENELFTNGTSINREL